MTTKAKKTSRLASLYLKLGLPIALVAGLFVGTQYPEFIPVAEGLSHILLSLLKLCVMPIILITITLGIYGIMTSTLKKKSLQFLIALVLFYLTASALGLGSAILSSSLFQDIDLTQSAEIQQVTQRASMVERDWDTPIEIPEIQEKIKGFDALSLVPDNIFSALNKSALIQIILFAILFGVSLSYTSRAAQKSIVPVFRGIEEIFNKIISVIMMFLPVIIFCTIAKQGKNISLDSLLAMMSFILSLDLSLMLLFVFATLLMRVTTGVGIIGILKNLKNPIFLSLATSSAMAVMPVALKSMNEDFKLDRGANEILIPLGIFLGKYGAAFIYAFATIFAATVYNIDLTLNDYFFITFMSIFLTISSIGTPAVIALSFLAIMFDPLGIPFGTIYTLLILVNLLIKPIKTIVNTQANCAFCTLFSKASKTAEKPQAA